MADTLSVALSGFGLGMAGSLHCASMCGCIASGALFLMKPPTLGARVGMLAKMQAARISSYVLMGAAAGGIASVAISPAASAVEFRLLQWVAAAIVMWVGLAMAGVVPRLAIPSRLLTVPALALGRLLVPLNIHRNAAPIAAGLVWGATPCPMVYAALFTASLTGSFSSGAVWMTGYGLGTVPAVTAAALGLTGIRAMRASPRVHIASGLLIAAFGLASATIGMPISAVLCTTP